MYMIITMRGREREKDRREGKNVQNKKKKREGQGFRGGLKNLCALGRYITFAHRLQNLLSSARKIVASTMNFDGPWIHEYTHTERVREREIMDGGGGGRHPTWRRPRRVKVKLITASTRRAVCCKIQRSLKTTRLKPGERIPLNRNTKPERTILSSTFLHLISSRSRECN